MDAEAVPADCALPPPPEGSAEALVAHLQVKFREHEGLLHTLNRQAGAQAQEFAEFRRQHVDDMTTLSSQVDRQFAAILTEVSRPRDAPHSGSFPPQPLPPTIPPTFQTANSANSRAFATPSTPLCVTDPAILARPSEWRLATGGGERLLVSILCNTLGNEARTGATTVAVNSQIDFILQLLRTHLEAPPLPVGVQDTTLELLGDRLLFHKAMGGMGTNQAVALWDELRAASVPADARIQLAWDRMSLRNATALPNRTTPPSTRATSSGSAATHGTWQPPVAVGAGGGNNNNNTNTSSALAYPNAQRGGGRRGGGRGGGGSGGQGAPPPSPSS